MFEVASKLDFKVSGTVVGDGLLAVISVQNHVALKAPLATLPRIKGADKDVHVGCHRPAFYGDGE